MSNPPVHAELIKLWANGAEIECLPIGHSKWFGIEYPSWEPSCEYRIKPQPKPDSVWRMCVGPEDKGNCGVPLIAPYDFTPSAGYISLTFDGETNELKAVEMVK